MVSAVILAGGKGERMNAPGVDKCFLALGSRPVIVWSLLAFENCPDVDQVVLVVRKEQIGPAKVLKTMFGLSKLVQVVAGGKSRQESVKAGLNAVDPDTRLVVIHDGARPCVRPRLISACIETARHNGGAVAAAPVTDTLKRSTKNQAIEATVDRTGLWTVQTPQAFKYDQILSAYRKVTARKLTVTDDASAMETAGLPVKLCEWTEPNIKITYPADLALAAAILQLAPR
ncbi:MAG: 2-C-methyl-D-erythritol 4-phosphate cytidylyltransferase [Kiritimatiellia bacterium]|nr:2-C-methyl-D-erythritol 4-phosphate cytidylyltransferase [Kiritimatiellia bacterium]